MHLQTLIFNESAESAAASYFQSGLIKNIADIFNLDSSNPKVMFDIISSSGLDFGSWFRDKTINGDKSVMDISKEIILKNTDGSKNKKSTSEEINSAINLVNYVGNSLKKNFNNLELNKENSKKIKKETIKILKQKLSI